MTTKRNEKLEFLRSGSEQDLLKEFKKNKALLKKLKTIKKIFDEVFEEAKERIELGEAKEDDEAIVMFHKNPELIFDFSETVEKMEIIVDYQLDALVLSTIDQFHFKSESKKLILQISLKWISLVIKLIVLNSIFLKALILELQNLSQKFLIIFLKLKMSL